jgi:hypothetical protein
MDRLPAGRGRRSVSTSKRALPVYCVSRPSLAIHSSGLVNHGTSRSLRRRSGTSALLSSPIEFENEKGDRDMTMTLLLKIEGGSLFNNASNSTLGDGILYRVQLFLLLAWTIYRFQ